MKKQYKIVVSVLFQALALIRNDDTPEAKKLHDEIREFIEWTRK